MKENPSLTPQLFRWISTCLEVRYGGLLCLPRWRLPKSVAHNCPVQHFKAKFLPVDGQEISAVSNDQLRAHARKIKELGIHAITIVGVYSPSYKKQEEDAAAFLAEEMGPGFDISCSHSIGQAGFLERENAAILNASIRRFSRQVVHSLDKATRFLVNAGLYITLNDGTLARASYAAANPLRCFSSGPTNSARGAAFLAREMVSTNAENGDRDLLVIDVGGTTTDVCSLLPNGYPRQSAACVKVAGVKTNFSMPDVHSIALGAGSVIRNHESQVSVGPDSVALEESTKALHSGGPFFTVCQVQFPTPVFGLEFHTKIAN